MKLPDIIMDDIFEFIEKDSDKHTMKNGEIRLQYFDENAKYMLFFDVIKDNKDITIGDQKYKLIMGQWSGVDQAVYFLKERKPNVTEEEVEQFVKEFKQGNPVRGSISLVRVLEDGSLFKSKFEDTNPYGY